MLKLKKKLNKKKGKLYRSKTKGTSWVKNKRKWVEWNRSYSDRLNEILIAKCPKWHCTFVDGKIIRGRRVSECVCVTPTNTAVDHPHVHYLFSSMWIWNEIFLTAIHVSSNIVHHMWILSQTNTTKAVKDHSVYRVHSVYRPNTKGIYTDLNWNKLKNSHHIRSSLYLQQFILFHRGKKLTYAAHGVRDAC